MAGDADSDAREARIGEIFAVEGDDLRARIDAIAAAAREEYLLAFTGERNPSAMRDLRELRLRLLYKHLPGDEPTDGQVAELFQITATQATTLIAGTRARYRTEMSDRLRRRAIAVLTEEATRVDDDTIRFAVDDSLARYMKELVNETTAPPLEKSREAARTYQPGRDTVRALCRKLGIDPTAVGVLDWS